MTSTELDTRENTEPDRTGRDGLGRFARTIETAERDAEMARMKARGLSYRQISAAVGLEVSAVHAAVQRAIEATIRQPAEEAKAAALHQLELSLERYEQMRDAIVATLERKHYVVSNGRLVYLKEEEEPLEDDAFVLAAMESLRRIEESRRGLLERQAKYLGLDAAQKVQVDVGVRYEIVNVDMTMLR